MNKEPHKPQFVFTRINYQLLIAALVVIAVGFALMSGGATDDPLVFNPEIFNFRRIRLAPAVVLAGFALAIYAILKKPAQD